MLNKDYERAISFLSGLHKKYADDPNIQHSLLDALLAVGKDETAVDWMIVPAVLKLDKHTLDYCYDYMRTKRKPGNVYDLYMELYNHGYPMFSREQLILLLDSDNRFIITGSKNRSYDCFTSVNRKRNTKKS